MIAASGATLMKGCLMVIRAFPGVDCRNGLMVIPRRVREEPPRNLLSWSGLSGYCAIVPRRLVGFVLMLLLANLGVTKALLSCEPAAGTVNAHAQHGAADARDEHAQHAQHGSQDESGDAAPDAAQCCQAMASCAATGDFATTAFAPASAITSMSAATALLGAPMARIAAPEPPPPRG